ncbi:MAG: three-helix bundle dimerization domain-containing protein [Dermatophilaceae bacterium]
MASFADDGAHQGVPEIDAGLHDVATFIHQEYDDRLDPRAVDECLDQVAARFADATVRSFVPLLVTRYVRAELQARLGQA